MDKYGVQEPKQKYKSRDHKALPGSHHTKKTKLQRKQRQSPSRKKNTLKRLVLASSRRITRPQHHDEVRAVAGEMAYRWRDKWQRTLQRKKKRKPRTDMVTTSLSSLPNRHQVSPGPVSRRRGINGKQETRKMKCKMEDEAE